MFNVISTLDFATCLFSIAAIIIVLRGWRNNDLSEGVKFTLLGLITLTYFHDFTNFLEWSGINYALEVEYYIEILGPVLWFLVFYLFSQCILRETLERAMRRYRTLFEAAGESILIADISKEKGARFVDCNDATLKIFGCDKREDILGKSPEDFSPEKQPDGKVSYEQVIEVGKRTLSGNPQFFEWVHLRPDGTPFDAEISLTPIELEDKIHILAITRDITDRKKIQQMKNTLIRDVSHTLKSPLAVVKMACSMIEKGITTSNMEIAKRGREIAEENIAKAAKDVDNILRMASFEASESVSITENKEVIPLKGLLEGIASGMYHFCTEKGLEIDVDIPDGADKVLALPNDCKLLFENIMDNACKFTKKGRVAVTSRLNGSFVDVDITDTGCGIDSNNIDKVFEKFYKRHPTVEGMGLGLSICKEIVTRNSGSIKIYSEGRDKGTKVVVSLLKGE